MADFRTEYEKIYEAIRNAIIAGQYGPGERLPQRKLAQRFHTTTITVREALRFLEQDGLILIEPKWGAMVVEITAEKIYGRYIVREALEGMAARLAAENATDEERRELMEMAEECDRELVSDRMSRQEKAGLHYELHEKIVTITRCPELIQSITRNNLHTVILSNAYHIDWLHDDPDRHRTLVQSILSRDPDRAERTMRAHVRDGYAMELKALRGGS
ncbi:MAG: GntR family transcriptional regulator [Spirochaetales bacterium]|nr:GntR family transcriptional regulator [Spirochaetales bacterium]